MDASTMKEIIAIAVEARRIERDRITSLIGELKLRVFDHVMNDQGRVAVEDDFRDFEINMLGHFDMLDP